MTDTERSDVVTPSRSLLVRTTLMLGLGIALAAGVLVLLFGPYLAGAFEAESSELLRDQAARADNAAQRDAERAISLLHAATVHAWRSADASLADLPIDLVTDEGEAVRSLVSAELGERADAAVRNVDAMAGELVERTERRLARDAGDVAARNAKRAEQFGDGMARRAGALLLALVAALFLLHGALLYRTVLAPVARLGEATREVARGRLGTRIPVRGSDEVAALAASFNTMTGSLEDARDELRSLNAELEDRVRRRTDELREKERELRQAEKMASLGTLAGGVAHEFNNLLGGILGCAEDAGQDTDPEELRETLAMIERTARRGTAITANLLRFARPAAPGGDVVELREVARDVGGLVEPEAARHGIEVVVDVPAGARVRGEAAGVHQVLLNLATNAIHAMQDGGTLRIGAERRGTEVEIAVEDTGVGIAPEQRARLFEPFFTTRPEGTGLGLSVTYGIVRAHGGRVEVESETAGASRGTTFRVVLPAATGGVR
jgi:signal transduction histidine kinase